jgi:hypothetical protein
MRRTTLLRTLTVALALLHTLPARKHLVAFIATPSWTEGWKGIGAAVAVALYLLPTRVQVRALQHLWRRRASALRVAGVVLAVAHAVPAADHLPRLVESFTFGDAWRGIGAAIAVVWFVAPLRAQARILAALAHILRPSSLPASRPIVGISLNLETVPTQERQSP